MSLPRGGRQIIPRPAGARPGRRNPWFGALTPEHATRERLEAVLDSGRTGAAGTPVVLNDHLRPPLLTSTRESAVLVPVFHGSDGSLRLLFTRRSSELRNHRHEVSFPGGRRDPGETLATTALREAFEEIALPPESVRVIGELEPLSTVRNPSAITPIVGFIETLPELRANQSEVERIFDLSVLDLVHPDCYREELWPLPEVVSNGAERSVRPSYPVHFFEVPGDTIWGATGRMLCRVLDLLTFPDV